MMYTANVVAKRKQLFHVGQHFTLHLFIDDTGTSRNSLRNTGHLPNTLFRNPQAFSSTIATLRSPQHRALGFQKSIDPLVLASNYYFEISYTLHGGIYQKLDIRLALCANVCIQSVHPTEVLSKPVAV